MSLNPRATIKALLLWGNLNQRGSKGKSNLLPELWSGEDDQVEEEVGSKGDEGEGDVHIP